MDTFRHDLRFALRLLAKDRAYALAVILTLALCLGANAAVFAVVQSVLIRPLPYPDADRIVFTYKTRFQVPAWNGRAASVPNHLRPPRDDGRLSVAGALSIWRGAGRRRRKPRGIVGSMTVTPSFFRVLRATAARGRLFTEADGEVGREHVAVLGLRPSPHGRPAGIDHVVGTTLRLNNEVYTVVGVLPQNFTFLNPEGTGLDARSVQAGGPSAEDQRYSQNNDEIGRLASRVTVQQAQARLNAFNATLLDRAGSLKQELDQRRLRHQNRPGFRTISSATSDPRLTLLWCGVLRRAAHRRREPDEPCAGSCEWPGSRSWRHATRLARAMRRVARQLATETVLLTVIGGALGIVMGTWCIDSLQAIGLSDVPRAYEIRLDATVVAFTLGLAVALGLVVGIVPAMLLAGAQPQRRSARGGPLRSRRTWDALHAPRPRHGASRARVRPARGCGPAAGEFPTGPGHRSRVQGLGRVDGPRKPARGPVSGRCSVEILRDARAATNPCPAGRRGGRHDELPAVRVGQFEQRDHR